MGIKQQSDQEHQIEMKIAATLFAFASASGANSADVVKANCLTQAGNKACWESYFTLQFNNATQSMEVNPDSTTGSCGIQYITEQSMVNSTCTVSASSGAQLNFGNGAFVNGADITGFERTSGVVSVIATWDTSMDAAAWTAENTNGTLQISNTTEFNQEDCFTTGLNRFVTVNCVDNGEAASNPMIMMTNNAKDAANNFAVANYGDEGNTLAVALGVPCDTLTIESSMGDITPGNNADCSFAITVTDDAPDLLYFTANTTEVVDFFAVTIA